MARIMTVCEAYDPEDPENKNEVYYYLLHWGLSAGKFTDENGSAFVSQWTVAICQNMKTGIINTFIPEAITILGYERANEKFSNWTKPDRGDR